MKKFLSLLLLIVLMLPIAACSVIGVEVDDDDKDDGTMTRLNIYNFDGGIGTEWLEKIEKEFEADYAEVSFAEGKKGVDIKITPSKNRDFSISNSMYNIFFSEGIRYNSLAEQNLLLDISDVVNASLSDVSKGEETGTIADKLPADKKAALTALDGKYYALPHYETYCGVFFDVDVFEEYGLYFLDDGKFCDEDSFENGVYMGTGKIACGPDGVFGTSDDGQPSSYEEFYKLLDRMVKKGVVPFIWTGQYADYYMINLVNGAWAAYQGADEMALNFTFGSGVADEKSYATIVTGFDGDTPITQQKLITLSSGYENSAQIGKYYGLNLVEKILSNSLYYSKKITGVLSHLDAQEEFIYSNLENAPIAMIIEGSYWYNEAAGAFTRSIGEYQDRARDRRYSMLSMPKQATGHVTEGNGKKNTLVDSLSSYALVNANIAGDAEKVAVAKAFLKYCYTDKAMRDFTVSTGVKKGVNYELTDQQLNSLDYYKKSIMNIRKESDVVYPMADNPIFVNKTVNFVLEFGSLVYSSTINKATYLSPYTAIKGGISGKDYFIGTWVSSYDWEKDYSAYYNK